MDGVQGKNGKKGKKGEEVEKVSCVHGLLKVSWCGLRRCIKDMIKDRRTM